MQLHWHEYRMTLKNRYFRSNQDTTPLFILHREGMTWNNQKPFMVCVLAENKHRMMCHGLWRGSCLYLPAEMVNINTPVECICHEGLFIWMVLEVTLNLIHFSRHLSIHRNTNEVELWERRSCAPIKKCTNENNSKMISDRFSESKVDKKFHFIFYKK